MNKVPFFPLNQTYLTKRLVKEAIDKKMSVTMVSLNRLPKLNDSWDEYVLYNATRTWPEIKQPAYIPETMSLSQESSLFMFNLERKDSFNLSEVENLIDIYEEKIQPHETSPLLGLVLRKLCTCIESVVQNDLTSSIKLSNKIVEFIEALDPYKFTVFIDTTFLEKPSKFNESYLDSTRLAKCVDTLDIVLKNFITENDKPVDEAFKYIRSIASSKENPLNKLLKKVLNTDEFYKTSTTEKGEDHIFNIRFDFSTKSLLSSWGGLMTYLPTDTFIDSKHQLALLAALYINTVQNNAHTQKVTDLEKFTTKELDSKFPGFLNVLNLNRTLGLESSLLEVCNTYFATLKVGHNNVESVNDIKLDNLSV